MKKLVLLILIVFTNTFLFAQTTTDLYKMFAEKSFPYEVPDSDGLPYFDEEEEMLVGVDESKSLSLELLKTSIGMEDVYSDAMFAVDKLEYNGVTLLIVVEENVDLNSGESLFSYSLITVSEGKFVSSEIITSYSRSVSYFGGVSIYSESETNSKLIITEDLQGNLKPVIFKTSTYFEKIDTIFGAESTTIDLTYHLINSDGEIQNVTLIIEDD